MVITKNVYDFYNSIQLFNLLIMDINKRDFLQAFYIETSSFAWFWWWWR